MSEEKITEDCSECVGVVATEAVEAAEAEAADSRSAGAKFYREMKRRVIKLLHMDIENLSTADRIAIDDAIQRRLSRIAMEEIAKSLDTYLFRIDYELERITSALDDLKP